MTQFVKIGTGAPYEKALPSQVELPVFSKSPVPHSVGRVFSLGDPEWEEALFRFMFLNGYCHPEDNEREQSGRSV